MVSASRAVAKVPCTCGELVQGMVDGRSFLVSCPIDIYSRVDVTLGFSDLPSRGGPRGSEAQPFAKARRAVDLTLAHLGLPGTSFCLEVSCPLPPAKGFGTSTADVVGAVAATAAAAGRAISPEQVAMLAVSVEPSDSTAFPDLALFDHRAGDGFERLGPSPPLLVVVLEFEGTVDTLEYNAGLDLARLARLEHEHLGALELLRRGLRQHRLQLIGEAATASALANQQLLPKTQLDGVIALARHHGALGVCVAHSGTAMGALFDPGEIGRAEEMIRWAGGELEGLLRGWVSRMVGGGARLLKLSEVGR